MRDGEIIGQTSLKTHLGEDNIKRVVNWTLRYTYMRNSSDKTKIKIKIKNEN